MPLHVTAMARDLIVAQCSADRVDRPHPAKPECQDYDAQRKKPVRQCVMRPGELIWVPDRWWHATCNLAP